MTDVVTSRQRSYNMSRIRGSKTAPEMSVRAAVRALGLRYRTNAVDLPGKPDLIIPSLRAAIFVHGCFWHRHRCSLGRPMPKTNAVFWRKKFVSNVDRDRKARRALARIGWKVVTVWQCQIDRHTRP